ncbi:MAG: class I SAM-dependent methyltransferase [Candidatus Magasanikbacteria bacterium]|nr:class I SAM-dependent methyltransferase [Candidatus Magasanikbacteria bacterium]
MIKKVLQKIGASENPILKLAAQFMRLPIRYAQWQLLKIHKDKNAISLAQTIQKDGDSLMWPAEMIQIYNCVFSVKKLDGDFAEVGVYSGRSSKLICEVKDDKMFHLFDTFDGLPEPTSIDSDSMHQHMYASSLDSVKTYLGDYKNVTFHPGMFPETAEPIKNRSFAFVHLDVDLYHSTLECLKFFYPRMVGGGIILSHDYSTLVGVKKAFDEFFADKIESVIELSTSQCLVVKELCRQRKT